MAENNKDIADSVLGRAAADLPGELAGKAAEAVGGSVLGSVVKHGVNSAVETVGETIVGDGSDVSKYTTNIVTAGPVVKPGRSRRFKKVVGALSSLALTGLLWGGFSLYNNYADQKSAVARIAVETDQAVERLERERRELALLREETDLFREVTPKVYAATREKPLVFDYTLDGRVSRCFIRGCEAKDQQYLEVTFGSENVTSLAARGWKWATSIGDADFSATRLEDFNLNGPDKTDPVRKVSYEEGDDPDDFDIVESLTFGGLSDAVRDKTRKEYIFVLRRAKDLID